MKIDSTEVRLNSLKPYIALLEKVAAREITLSDFEHRYFGLFKANETMWDEPEYKLLNDLFLDLDEFYPDPSLRDPGDLDEAQITSRISHALEQLKVRMRELDSSISE